MIIIKNIIKKLLHPCIKYLNHRGEKKRKLNLDCSLWGLNVNERSHLIIGGCDCIELVEEYGTPIHVLDSDLLKKNYNEFCESLKFHDINFEIYYSYKTNPIPGILKILHANNAGAEVISPYELWLALKLGVSPDSIIYNGPNKSNAGLKTAIKNKIKLININSFNEIETIKNIAEEFELQVKVGIRICTSVGWGSQFGFKIDSGEAFNALNKLNEIKCMEIEGIHMHLGTKLKDSIPYERAIDEVFKFVKKIKDRRGVFIKYFDVGGGFSVPTIRPFKKFESKLCHTFNIPYSAPRVEDTQSIRTFADRIAIAIKKECEKYKLKLPVVIFEPGRAITSNAQILLAKVGDFKRNSELKIALIDAGINIASPVSSEYHEIFVANKMTSNYKEFYSLAGPICTPQDLLYKSKKLPVLEVGDIVAIMDAGAYFTSFSNNFSFPRPAVIMVAKGNHCVLREKESFEDMTRLDHF